MAIAVVSGPRVSVLFLLCALGMSCHGTPQQLGHGFAPGEVIGHTFEVEDEGRVAVYSFHSSGEVVTTLGLKGGPVSGPVLLWSISRAGTLVLEQAPGKIFCLLEKVDRIGSRYVLLTTRGGYTAVAVFRRTLFADAG